MHLDRSKRVLQELYTDSISVLENLSWDFRTICMKTCFNFLIFTGFRDNSKVFKHKLKVHLDGSEGSY
jgi:hypothetical protein